NEVAVVGLYKNGKEVYEALKTTAPDIAIVDINMPEINGQELTQLIKKDYPQVKVIILAMYDDAGHIMELIEAGASGYLLKNVTDKELIKAIKTVASGKNYYCDEVTDRIAAFTIENQKKSDALDRIKLTDRELEILQLIAKVYSNAQIAASLFISVRTVETHRNNMLRKTNNKTIVGLLKYAFEHQIL